MAMNSCLLVLLWFNSCITCLEYGTCDEKFIIFKHTVATSDSNRECENTYNIFPEIDSEGADKFHNGQCAYQCKLELPYTCFRIHAPQTRYDEGLLYIDTFEHKMSEKWKYALNHNYKPDYDSFFDFNMGFWVKSLDQYILHWTSNKNIDLEYFGIEWYLNDDLNVDIDDKNYKNNKFYSILIHSPSSAINFEFISYTKPSNDLYKNMKWITDDIPRCTFQISNNPYPWNRNDDATIVPIRISHATTDIHKLYDFYTNVLEADLIYYVNTKYTKTIYMHLINTHIEIQFIQRPDSATFGDFTLDLYENLLMETHETIITSPYCGQDRWMDDHYAYSTYTIPGLMDKIYVNLNEYNIKYKVGKSSYQHASEHTKSQLDLVGFSGEYTFGLWVIEPTGQSIKIGGIISNENVAKFASIGDPQWCPKTECNFGAQGTVDPSHIYQNDLRSSQHDEDGDMNMYNIHLTKELQLENDKKQYILYAIVVVLSMVLLCVASSCFCYNKTMHNYDDYVSI